jgi:putative membrane protein
MLRGGSEIIDCFTLGVVTVTILVIVLVSEDRLVTAALLILTGLMGMIVNSGTIPVFGIIDGGTLLFPLLTGLFGLPPLLDTASGGRIPAQCDDGTDPVGPVPGIRGVATGIIAGWFPGITATAGATLASAVTRENDPARFISMTASIGTVTSVFSVVTLSVSGSGRSGPCMAVKQVIGDSLGGFCSEAFVLILMSMALASLLGYAATIGAGKMMVRISGRISPETMGNAVLALIVILVLLFTGPFGLAVLVISAAVGRIPPAFGVSRVCLTGCLMVPVVLNTVL